MLDSFQHFLLVAESQTLTAAAKRAHLTQPAMTLSLQRLESELSARLFARTPKGMVLTAAGRALLPRARAALAAIEDARRSVSETAGVVTGIVRLGAGATVCSYYLPRVLARFRKAYPHVQIHVREARSDALAPAVEGGEIDLAILAEPRASRDRALFGITREHWQKDSLILVTAPRRGKKAGSVRRVIDARTPFISFPPGSTTRDLLSAHFPEVNVVMELGGIAAIKSNVRAGVGVALVSARAVERDVAAGGLAVVSHPETPIVRNLTIAHRGVLMLPPAAARLRLLLLRMRR